MFGLSPPRLQLLLTEVVACWCSCHGSCLVARLGLLRSTYNAHTSLAKRLQDSWHSLSSCKYHGCLLSQSIMELTAPHMRAAGPPYIECISSDLSTLFKR